MLVALVDEKIVGSGYSLIKESKPHKKPAHYTYLGLCTYCPNTVEKVSIKK